MLRFETLSLVVVRLDAGPGASARWLSGCPHENSLATVEHLLVHDGKLYLAGGTAVSPAVYDLVTGKCLNDPTPLKDSRSTAIRGQELYKVGDKIVVGGPPLYGHPEYRVYDPTVTNKLLHTSAHGRNVLWVNSWLNRKKLVCLENVDEEMLDRCLRTFEGFPNSFVVDWERMDNPVKSLWEYDCSGSVGRSLGRTMSISASNSAWNCRATNMVSALEAMVSPESSPPLRPPKRHQSKSSTH